MFDSHGNLDVLGRLATDRPHRRQVLRRLQHRAQHADRRVRVCRQRHADDDLRQHGQPDGVFVEGRGDMGRTPLLSKTDLLVSHELAMAGNKRLRLELNVLNLFNQKTARHIFNFLNRGAGVAARRRRRSTCTNTTSYKGYDYNALIQRDTGRRRTHTIRATAWRTCSKPGTQGQVR